METTTDVREADGMTGCTAVEGMDPIPEPRKGKTLQ
jgi:hypothetical protein